MRKSSFNKYLATVYLTVFLVPINTRLLEVLLLVLVVLCRLLVLFIVHFLGVI